jgi:hypothetical protein
MYLFVIYLLNDVTRCLKVTFNVYIDAIIIVLIGRYRYWIFLQ